MKGISQYAIIYDLSSNRERRKVEMILKGFGLREQKSVFECKMNRKSKVELTLKLNSLNLKSGFVKIYRLDYSQCSPIIGLRDENTPDAGNVFVF